MEQAGKPGEKRRGDRGKKGQKNRAEKTDEKKKGEQGEKWTKPEKKKRTEKRGMGQKGKTGRKAGRRSETFEQHVGVNGDSLALADIAETLVGPRRNTDGGGIETERVREGEAHGVDVF